MNVFPDGIGTRRIMFDLYNLWFIYPFKSILKNRTNYLLAPGVCFLQPCSSAGRRFAASRSRVHKYRRIVSFPQNFDEMSCKLDFTENPHSFKKYPTPPERLCSVYTERLCSVSSDVNRFEWESVGILSSSIF